MNYIVFDLEWNQCPDGKEKEIKDMPFEIIEIGADKLDNCRVKLEESMETLLGVDEKGVGEGVIAPKVWESCMAKESVLSSDRVSKVDYWISYIAQYYDINFPETYEIMREHDYVKRIMDRVPYALPETQEKMDILAAEMEKYMDERIRNRK